VAFFLFCSLALLLAIGLLGQPYWLAYRRKRLLETAFPAEWRRILRERVPLVRKMPQHLQMQLKKHMQVFIAEKSFLGCGGLQVTEEMRVVIAAQACLLILNRATDYFANVRQILVYPGAFVVNKVSVDAAGVHQEGAEVRLGESWTQGQVVLSWDDALHGARVADDGYNVVIHEFAHQLDQENGAARGAPPPLLGDATHDAQRWSEVFRAAYAHLQAQARSGEQGLIDYYGAQDPAEFFAVVSEVFFEQPQALAAEYPALYQELQGYYKLDPASW
jgi:Mlc titration factor MtfA (ptsG expression regulator)